MSAGVLFQVEQLKAIPRITMRRKRSVEGQKAILSGTSEGSAGPVGGFCVELGRLPVIWKVIGRLSRGVSNRPRDGCR